MMIRAAYIELLFIVSALILAGVYTLTYDLRFLVSGLILACFPTLYETLLKIAKLQTGLNNDEYL